MHGAVRITRKGPYAMRQCFVEVGEAKLHSWGCRRWNSPVAVKPKQLDRDSRALHGRLGMPKTTEIAELEDPPPSAVANARILAACSKDRRCGTLRWDQLGLSTFSIMYKLRTARMAAPVPLICRVVMSAIVMDDACTITESCRSNRRSSRVDRQSAVRVMSQVLACHQYKGLLP